MTEKTVFMRN